MSLRDVYLAVLERAPEPLRPAIRGLAAGVRHLRRSVRRMRRRVGRLALRTSMALEVKLRRTEGGRRMLLWGHRVTTVGALRWFPKLRTRRLVHVPGVRFRLVDATGLSASDAVRPLPSDVDDIVLIVDDPDLAPVRAAGVRYEYVPAAAVADGGLRPDSARFRHLCAAYGVRSLERLESLRSESFPG